MLDRHLICETSPKANPQNVLFYGDYRLTLLTDRLLRVEKSRRRAFTDAATQTVWYRFFAPVPYTACEKDDGLEIRTKAVTFFIAKAYKNSYCEWDNKRVPFTNKGNLLGTYRTLDRCDGARDKFHGWENAPAKYIRLGKGVCSKTGVAVVDDVNALLLNESGEITPRPQQEKDEYIFAYGHDYRGAVKALYQITGFTPMIPRFALGNWWSRYHKYTAEEYVNVLDRFRERDIPFTVATVDMDWHYSDFIREELGVTETGEEYGCAGRLGWTGYTWNKNLFPDYKGFLKEVKKRGYKITLNLHPKEGVRYFEDAYPDMCERLGVDPKTKKPVVFDFTDPAFINAYFDVLHQPYEADGVDFWWIDWQQGTKSKLAGLDPLWALNHYHTLDNAKNHDVPLILSRYAGVGSHRYPLGFSGDTFVTYRTLAYLPYFTATASNAGYSWWSHDIGGHMCGVKNNELYLRHLQYGVFSPVMRLHSTCTETVTKEPWFYGAEGRLAEEALRFRHALIPFLYTAAYATHTEGKPLVEPLYYEYPEEEKAYEYKNEYLFGGLLVAPVTTASVYKGLSATKAWLPEGEWTDLFTGETYTAKAGGRELTFYRYTDSIPVLAKAGTILPFSADKHTNACDNPRALELRVYRGNGAYTLYEDAGGKKAFTVITASLAGGKQTVEIAVKGDASVLPAGRTVRVRFIGLPRGGITVTADGEPVAADVNNYDGLEATITLSDYAKTYRVTADGEPLSQKERGLFYAKEAITRFEGDNEEKKTWYEALETDPAYDGTKESLEKILEGKPIPSAYFNRLLETQA